jgi:hypothetical protein
MSISLVLGFLLLGAGAGALLTRIFFGSQIRKLQLKISSLLQGQVRQTDISPNLEAHHRRERPKSANSAAPQGGSVMGGQNTYADTQAQVPTGCDYLWRNLWYLIL